MPFFGAIALLPGNKIQKRKPLNHRSLMNGRLNSFQFSTITSTGARSRGQELQTMCAGNCAMRLISPESGQRESATGDATSHHPACHENTDSGSPIDSELGLQATGRQLIRNSIHLEGEILQFPVTFHLENDRITKPKCAYDRLELRHRLQRSAIDGTNNVPGLQPRVGGS